MNGIKIRLDFAFEAFWNFHLISLSLNLWIEINTEDFYFGLGLHQCLFHGDPLEKY